MMREILLKGKTLTGAWVEGAYYKQEEFYGDSEDASIIITSKETLDYDQALFFSVVIPETVGQYTGLCDKTGKKIFEGDIVRKTVNGKELIGKVEYAGGAFGVRFADGSGQFLCFFVGGCEIIGNIHDNPELLKGGAE